MNMMTQTKLVRPQNIPLMLGARDLDLIRYTLHSAPKCAQDDAQRIIATLDQANSVLASVNAGVLALRPIGAIGWG